MSSDYSAIKEDHKIRYGTDIKRMGKMLLSDRYADRSHFIFELLQNAEDAHKRRHNKTGDSSVTFELYSDHLRVSHFGQSFTEEDVIAICGIAQSTKAQDMTSIGCFGIGFKAVYQFTDLPEIHSGDEHFAIESYVLPEEIDGIKTKPNETVFIFPFRKNDKNAFDDIALGLEQLGVRTLLFLKEIEEINWSVIGEKNGQYLRDKPFKLAKNLHKITLMGTTEQNQEEITEESWLLCSRSVKNNESDAGIIEIAFALEATQKDDVIKHIQDSKLVVFFPTNVSTNLGFLIQGPYRTTPSRDNIPTHDDWNQYLIEETSSLLIEMLLSLRELELLNIKALLALPLDVKKFEDTMFEPLFNSVQQAIREKALLPKYKSGYTSAENALLARTQELRELLSPNQLTQLFPDDGNIRFEEYSWLSDDITRDRTLELRQYLMGELDVREITPEVFARALTKDFLEQQSDKWIIAFYQFLARQSSLYKSRITNQNTPIIRTEDGVHTSLMRDGQRQVFMPTQGVVTDFPTVRKSLCADEAVHKFLQDFGVTAPDIVDDVIKNILPQYTLLMLRS